jgi:hypothetical protein
VKNIHPIVFELARKPMAPPDRMKYSAQQGVGQAHVVARRAKPTFVVRRVQPVRMFRIVTAQPVHQRPAVKAQTGGIVEIAFGVECNVHKFKIGCKVMAAATRIWYDALKNNTTGESGALYGPNRPIFCPRCILLTSYPFFIPLFSMRGGHPTTLMTNNNFNQL